MKLHNLRPAAGSTKNNKRIGRGQASGTGGTAGKGHKGQQSRTGYTRKVGFEGGQTPLQTRVPKRGFKSFNRVAYKEFNLGQIDALVEKYNLEEFSLQNLYDNSLIQRTDRVKVLGNGTLTKKINFQVHAVSAKAKEAIEAVGGSVEII